MQKSCKQMRETGECTPEPYIPKNSPKTQWFKTIILGAITAKRKAWDKLSGSSKDEKEKDMRDVFKDLAFQKEPLTDIGYRQTLSSAASSIGAKLGIPDQGILTSSRSTGGSGRTKKYRKKTIKSKKGSKKTRRRW